MVKQLLRHQREANLSIMLHDSAEGSAAYVRLHRLLWSACVYVCICLGGSARREEKSKGVFNEVME